MTTKTTNVPAIDATIASMYRSAVSEAPDGGNWAAADGARLTLTFANGETLVLSSDNLSLEIRLRAMMHGLKQKLVDAAAISRNTETGRAASVDDKYAAVREVYDRLLSGEWNKRREGGSGTSGGLLFRALCRMYDGKKTADDIRAFLDSKTDAEKAALRKNSKVAAIIEEIRAESATGDAANGDDLLAGLED